jgi:acyl-CoA thioester hydrolase
MSFPYALPPLDRAAPFDRHRGEVRPEWIDGNGHMNVGYYLVAFDLATDTFCEQFGIGWDYVEHQLGMVFVVEAHATYDREVRGGDPLRITTQILEYDEKRLHFFHAMYHGEAGWLAATNELLMLHIDHATRRAAPWRAETLQRIEEMAAAHRALPRPDRAGRVIAIRHAAV